MSLLVTCVAVACGTGERLNHDPKSSTTLGNDAVASPTPAHCYLCDSWSAIRVTIDGASDPEMDPTGKVIWNFRPDSTFKMHDETEGGPEELTGNWRLGNDSMLILTAAGSRETLPFKVRGITDAMLIVQVMEDAEGEVLLYFTRTPK